MISTDAYFRLVKDTFVEYELAKPNEEIIQVWYCKTIQNHKGLFIVRNEYGSIRDFFFECTYNGDKEELYIDTYLKTAKFIKRKED